MRAYIFEVGFSILDGAQPPRILLTEDQLRIMEWVVPAPNIEVLIGLDILRECLLIIDGKRGVFTLGD